jgi:hypothetical protein
MSEVGLKLPEPAGALADFAPEGGRLGQEEFGVTSDQHGALGAQDVLAGAQGPTPLQVLSFQGVGAGQVEQIRVLGRAQGSHEMVRAVIEARLIRLAVIALIVDERDCHFEDILADMKHIFAALTTGSPLFRALRRFPRKRR